MQAGAGIVYDSIAFENEYQETVNKAKSMISDGEYEGMISAIDNYDSFHLSTI